MVTIAKAHAAILLGIAVVGGIAIGWAISPAIDNSAMADQTSDAMTQQEPTALISQRVETPAPPRWMLTSNEQIVVGEKFLTAAECEQGRGRYVDTIVARVQTQIEATWGKGYTMREYPYYQEDVRRAQALIAEAEATYCRSYSV